MKYLFDPLTTSNPYQSHSKSQIPHPYQLLQENQSPQHKDHPINQPDVKIFCHLCKKEITHHSHIKSNTNHFCVSCFSQKQNFPQTYSLQQKLDFPLFQRSWSAYQQILLLKSIQKWGFGNWSQIQDYMEYFGSKFTSDQIQTHYNTFYLHQNSFQPRFSQVLIEKKKKSRQHIQKTFNGSNPVSFVSFSTNLPQDEYNLRFSQMQDFSHEPIINPISGPSITMPPQNIPGYNNFRKQFDVNFDQNAQKSLANLQFREDDLPQQRQIKLKIIEEYNQKLKKRYQVQDFIVQHRLLDKQFLKQQQENRSVYEKQSASQLQKIMKFTTFQQFNQLVKRLAMQKQLKSIIEGLRGFRKPSNSGKLKDVFQTLKKRQFSPSNSKSKGKSRKIIHVDETNSSSSQNQNQVMKRLKINMKDIKHIINESSTKKNGQGFVYKEVQVNIVQKK